MKVNQSLEKEIEQTLSKKAESIKPSDELFNRIREQIYQRECSEMKVNKNKPLRKSKKILVAMASCLALGSITVVGLTNMSSRSGSTMLKYHKLPVAETILEDAGFLPKYTETLPPDFEYVRGGVGEGSVTDEMGEIIAKTKNVSFGYQQAGDSRYLSMHATQIDKALVNNIGAECVAIIEGNEIYYTAQLFKFVPPDYEMTDEDKAEQAAGQLVISIGAPEISIEEIQSVSWYEDGIEYYIGGNDFGFEVDEMVDMAEYVITEGEK
ncbi:MAG: hypothetical protein ACRDDX_13045 [Cellulosilyticaceae bacterium]